MKNNINIFQSSQTKLSRDKVFNEVLISLSTYSSSKMMSEKIKRGMLRSKIIKSKQNTKK